MLPRYRQLQVAVVRQATAYQPGVELEVGTAEAALDRDFPEADRTEARLVRRIFEQRPCLLRQPAGLTGRPQQDVGVQQQPQASPESRSAISVSRMRSQSYGTVNCPAMKPRDRKRVESGTRVCVR